MINKSNQLGIPAGLIRNKIKKKDKKKSMKISRLTPADIKQLQLGIIITD